ncbi:MAG: 1-phosphofructokinase family hexose kinase [Monoglobales bacterium]
MFYTLTANPSVDLNITSEGLVKNEVNRTRNAVYTTNGKGVNVSFALKHFGIDSCVLGFFGGFSGEYILSECEKKGLKTAPILLDGITRINVFLNDGSGEYVMVNEGPEVPQEKQDEFLGLLERLEDAEYLCIGGSLPRDISTDYYDKILKICEKTGTKVIIDISSPKLKDLLSYRPLLIKPNDQELREIFGMNLRSVDDVKSALLRLYEMGAQNILLTLGEKGSYFYNGKEFYSCDTYKVKLLSSACAGDCFLSAFLGVWLTDPSNVKKALRLGAGAGANAAESAGIGDLQNAAEYSKHITVKKI